MRAIDIALGFQAEQRVHTFVVNTTKDTDMDIDQIDQILTRIADEHLQIETLETRKLRCLDFHDLAVWCLRDALEAAFNAGVEQGRKQVQQTSKANVLAPSNG